MKLPFARRALAELEDAPPAPAAASSWQARALSFVSSVWLRVDQDLRVVEASQAAMELFEAAPPPQSLIAFTRTAAIENHAREVAHGAAGPWEIEATHFHRVLLLHGLSLGADGSLLYLEDITDLRRLEAVRSDFVANLAHELRTPIASLSLAAETLSHDLPPDEQQLFAERIAEEALYLEGLLRTVTELAVLEGAVQLSLADFPLAEVVDASWRRTVDRLGEAPIQNSVPAGLSAYGDKVRVAEVLQNLLDNAHRFSPAGRPVAVGAEQDLFQTTVWVADEGPGIPPADLPRIFERFYKVDRARTRTGKGSGLGLAISKHLVSAHGGSIWAEAGSEAGTVIKFTLPARLPEVAAETLPR